MSVAASNRARIAGSSFLLFCMALFLSAYSEKHPAVARAGSAALLEITGPVQTMTNALYRRAGSLWTDYMALLNVREEMKLLTDRHEMLQAENARLAELGSENSRLRGILGMAGRQEGYSGISADVIGYDPSNWVKAVTVLGGLKDGIKSGMAVVEGAGVVGQVIAAGPATSRVLLVTDHGSGVDAIVQGSRIRGVVAGAGSDGCELRYVPVEEEVKIGDRIVTSGMDGVYPKGLVIGSVTDTQVRSSGLFRSVWLKPAVDFSRLETVFIISGGGSENDKQE